MEIEKVNSQTHGEKENIAKQNMLIHENEKKMSLLKTSKMNARIGRIADYHLVEYGVLD